MKTVFKNKTFFYLLISFICILLLWNLYALISAGSIWAIVAVLIQIVLLILIVTNHQYARISIIAWTIIAFVGSCILGLLASLLDIGNDLIDKTKSTDTNYIVFKLIQLIIGILILDFTRRTVKVERVEIAESEQLQP
jgi:hypothetical protein